MKYADGTLIKLGDRVRVRNGDVGIVVASMDSNEYSAAFPEENYAHLKVGIMVLTDNGALVHFEDPPHSKLLLPDLPAP